MVGNGAVVDLWSINQHQGSDLDLEPLALLATLQTLLPSLDSTHRLTQSTTISSSSNSSNMATIPITSIILNMLILMHTNSNHGNNTLPRS